MRQEPKISILVAAFNIEPYIKDCLESALNQTYTNIEIIVVDDGSTDNTCRVIDDFALRDKRIIPVHKNNGGLVSARKAGLERASGDYVFFLDGDDSIPPEAIESLTSCTSESTDIVVSDYRIIKANGKETVRSYGFTSGDKYDLINCMMKNSLCCIWGNLYRRSLFENVMLPIELKKSIGEDLVTNTQLIFYSNKEIKYTPAISYNYQMRETSLTGKRTELNIWVAGFEAFRITREFIFRNNFEDKVRQGLLKITSTYLSGVLSSYNGYKEYKEELVEMARYISSNWSVGRSKVSLFQRFQLRMAHINICMASLLSRGWIKLVQLKSKI